MGSSPSAQKTLARPQAFPAQLLRPLLQSPQLRLAPLVAPLQPPHPPLQRPQRRAQPGPGLLGRHSRARTRGSRWKRQGSQEHRGYGPGASGRWSQYHKVHRAGGLDGWARGLLWRRDRLLRALGTP